MIYIYGYDNITLLWYDYILITTVIYPTTYTYNNYNRRQNTNYYIVLPILYVNDMLVIWYDTIKKVIEFPAWNKPREKAPKNI